jgi:hypothetical protein
MKVFIGDPCQAMSRSDYYEMLSHSYWADDFDDGTINHPFCILSSSDEFTEEELQDAMWEIDSGWNEDSSSYPEIPGKVINAVKRCSTWIGDGCYADEEGDSYYVDSGQLGIVPSHMWPDDVSEERLNWVGLVTELPYQESFYVYDKCASGTLWIAERRIITGPADYDGNISDDE